MLRISTLPFVVDYVGQSNKPVSVCDTQAPDKYCRVYKEKPWSGGLSPETQTYVAYDQGHARGVPPVFTSVFSLSCHARTSDAVLQ